MIVEASSSVKKPSVHEKALRRLSMTGLSLIGLFFGTIGVWASVSTLSGAVVAPAQFVVDGYVKKVQHPTGGIVGELLVKRRRPGQGGRCPDPPRRDPDSRQLQIVDEAARRTSGPAGPARGRARRRATIETPKEFLSRRDDPAVAKLIGGREDFSRPACVPRGAEEPAAEADFAAPGRDRRLQAQPVAKEREASLIETELKGVRESMRRTSCSCRA